MNKQKDFGQKWRTLKNIARVFKNPAGFVYWRYMYKHKQNRAMNLWYAGMWIFIGSAVLFMSVKSHGKLIK